MNRLSSWNARANAWLLRRAWGYGLFNATVFVVTLAIIQRDNLSDRWGVLAAGWVLIFLVGELARRWTAKRPPPPRSDRAYDPDAMEEDGRRWRQGLP